MPFKKSPDTDAAASPTAPFLETSRKAALSLLGATPFLLTFSESGDRFVWPDEGELCLLLRSPKNRLPHNQADFHNMLDDLAQHSRIGAIKDLLWDGDQYQITYQITAFDGSLRWIEERGERVAGTRAQATHIQGVLADVTETKQKSIHRALHASQDALTGLWNRSRFLEALEYQLLASDLRHHAGFVICLQISNSDYIRREIGGDALEITIKDIAKYLRTTLTIPCRAARISPSGFGILLPGFTQDQAERKVERHIKSFQAQKRDHLFSDLPVEFSLSGRPMNDKLIPASDVLNLIETQLKPYSGKCEFLPKTENQPATRRKTFSVEEILEALNDRRICAAYQPIIHAKSRDVHHYECLLRLQNDDGTIVSAAHMIMDAEALGYVHLLDQRALDIATLTLRQNPEIELAVNVSAGTIANEFALQSYLQSLRSLGADARRLTIELTETLHVDDINTADGFATEVKAIGCRFAIDDFGKGHTSFQTLSRLNADVIKIDGSMVKDLADAPHKQAFIRMMVDLARTTGVETVAEMVSSEADAKMMEELGVTYFQSYIFGMPSPEPVLQSLSA